MSSLRRIVCLTVASTALFPAASSAATWSAPVRVFTSPSEGLRVWETQLASDAAGNQTAVWTDDVKVYAADKPAGGAWTAPAVIGTERGEDLTLSVSADGHAIVAWGNRIPKLTAVTRAPGGAWSQPELVRSEINPAGGRFLFSVAAGPSEPVAASILQREIGLKHDLVFGPVQPTLRSGGTWTAGAPFTGAAQFVRVGVDGSGNATLIFQSAQGLLVSTKTPAGAWTTPSTLTADSATTPTLSVNAAGAALVTWTTYGSGHQQILGKRRSTTGAWSAAEVIADLPAGEQVSDLDAEIDTSGRSTALWNQWGIPGSPSTGSEVKAATAGAGGAWAAPTTLEHRDLGVVTTYAQLSVAGTDRAVATWVAPTGEFKASVRRSGAAFEPAGAVAPATKQLRYISRSAISATAAGGATFLRTEDGDVVTTDLAAPAPTATPTPVATPTPTPVVTPTPVASPTPAPAATPTVTPAPSKAPKVTSVGGVAYGFLGGIAIVNGSNLSDVTAVTFGEKKAATGFAIGTGLLVVVAPPQNAGTYPVSVETKAGISAPGATFTYKKLF